MSIEWFDKEPGSAPISKEENAFLIGEPDWIRVPDHPGMPGGPRKVLGIRLDPCPLHKNHLVKHYQLEGPVQVAECTEAGFLWYRRHDAI